jgi:hypothetical protein
MGVRDRKRIGVSHTGRKGLLELLGLVAVLEDKGVELAAAADLELDLLVGVLLHTRGCCKKHPISQIFSMALQSLISSPPFRACDFLKRMLNVSTRFPLFSRIQNPLHVGQNVQEASLRRQISMKLLMSEISRGMLAVFD